MVNFLNLKNKLLHIKEKNINLVFNTQGFTLIFL